VGLGRKGIIKKGKCILWYNFQSVRAVRELVVGQRSKEI